ncbi:PREDICTED: glandular kallikrein-3, submandibular-like [Cyprinodon variegatus]|uniref:glandular kallikrein-3, submandibular-like n=1 Tax=Cyprinodon variegatus TaxID=28743 RepID=UPI000742AA91|nr:PREDICTED: glandular kallikrein-3, submandibular-like [Cyprinodon variegatus]
MCSVAGWGKTETNNTSNDLRVVSVSIINKEVCNGTWQYTLPPNVICAGGYNTEKGFCQGDSGGPLVCNGIAVGVVSFNRNNNCDYPNVPNVYTDISKYRDWLKHTLSGKAPLNKLVKTLPIPKDEIKLKEGEICSVAGWGKTENKDFTVDDMRVVNVSLLNPKLCQRIWGPGLPPKVICAGGYNTNKGFCQGDSGGPLVCNGMAVGVVSFNRLRNCKYPDVPNVYTDISKYLQWINKNMKTKECVK